MDPSHARHAERFGLTIVDPQTFVLEVRRHGRGVRLIGEGGATIRDRTLKSRVRKLVIPPAWSGVRICAEEFGHIQAFGRDGRGRKQYRYHDQWVAVRNAVKTERLVAFGNALPGLRERVASDMSRQRRDRRATAALAIRLIDLASMRPGHEKYAADGGLGVASLRRNNLRIVNNTAVMRFTGKSGQKHRIDIREPDVIKALDRARRGKGRRLLRFRARAHEDRHLTAEILNAYIHEAAGDPVSAKDFRTFRGSAEALRHLIEEAPAEALSSRTKTKKAVTAAMRSTAAVLRNTPAVARSSYVHPAIVSAFEAGELSEDLVRGPSRQGLSREETALMRFLERYATLED